MLKEALHAFIALEAGFWQRVARAEVAPPGDPCQDLLQAWVPGESACGGILGVCDQLGLPGLRSTPAPASANPKTWTRA